VAHDGFGGRWVWPTLGLWRCFLSDSNSDPEVIAAVALLTGTGGAAKRFWTAPVTIVGVRSEPHGLQVNPINGLVNVS
jgi:hypothetical protein